MMPDVCRRASAFGGGLGFRSSHYLSARRAYASTIAPSSTFVHSGRTTPTDPLARSSPFADLNGPRDLHRTSHNQRLRHRRLILGAGAIILSLGGLSYLLRPPSSASPPSPSLSRRPTTTLLRSYLVWTLTSIPPLVDSSPKLLEWGTTSSIPGAKTLTEWIVRKTFFAQFIPGETATECLLQLESTRKRNVGHALNYSAEGDSSDSGTAMNRYTEICRALDLQGEFERRMEKEGWDRGSSAFALKTILTRASTAILRLQAISSAGMKDIPYPGAPTDICSDILASSSTTVPVIAQSAVPGMRITADDAGLQPGDMEALKLLWQRLDSLVNRAKRNGIRFIIDAEESWLQPALDGYTQLLSMRYNKIPTKDPDASWTGPVIYGTYQSYLTRQPAFIDACLSHAEANDYVLGLKVVRGGYIVKESAFVKQPGREGPSAVWPSKGLTDAAYNGAITKLLGVLSDQLDRRSETAISVIFGTHNRESVDRIIQELEDTGLAARGSSGTLQLRDDVKGKVGIAQLYGMKEDLCDVVLERFESSTNPISLTFVAYGSLLETMPFLGRRAIENKSILSGENGAAAERRRVGMELRRRFFGFWS